MVKAGVTTSINTKHQCITAMKEYENKSLEVSLQADVQTNVSAAALQIEMEICAYPDKELVSLIVT